LEQHRMEVSNLLCLLHVPGKMSMDITIISNRMPGVCSSALPIALQECLMSGGQANPQTPRSRFREDCPCVLVEQGLKTVTALLVSTDPNRKRAQEQRIVPQEFKLRTGL